MRSLGLPARTVRALLNWQIPLMDYVMPAGHAWTEVYLGPEGQPAWRQADSTWNKAINQQAAYAQASDYSGVRVAWADKYALSSSSSRQAKENLCVAACYQSPIDCTVCRKESDAFKLDLFPDLSCVDEVQSNYGTSLKSVWAKTTASGRLLLTLQAPTAVTRGVPFDFSVAVTNDTTAALNSITIALALRQYADSTADLFQVAQPYQILTDVGAGETVPVNWQVTPLISGQGLPLRISAEAGELFEFSEQPLVVNEPGTLPDLSLTGICGLGNASPGQQVALTAGLLDENLAAFSSPAASVVATVRVAATSQIVATVSLLFCESCGAFQGSFSLPPDALTGQYTVTFEATHSSYDSAMATGAFFVVPPIVTSLSVDQDIAGVLDAVTLSANVIDRMAAVTGAAVSAEITTPGGTVSVPLPYDASSGQYRLVLHPADLAANLGGEILAGAWQVQATANYQGASSSDDAALTVIGSYPLSEVTISKSGPGTLLTWPDMGDGVDHYEVYRSASAYFFASGTGSTKVGANVAPGASAGDELSLPDPDAFATPGPPYFYMVQPVDASGQFFAGSNRTGAFSFTLTLGTSP